MMDGHPLKCAQIVFLLAALLLLCELRSVAAYPIISRTKQLGALRMCSSDALLEDTRPPLETEISLISSNTLYTDDSFNHNEEQVNGLESSLVDFEPITKSDRAWLLKYNLLLDYYIKHHHTLIPVADATLGRWVQRQRSYYKQGTLAEDRIKALNQVKFVFDARNYNNKVPTPKKWQKRSWEERYAELKKYYDAHGHCNVPVKSSSLGGWVQYQRQCNDKGKLSTYQIDKLNEIGFIWNLRKHQWEQRFTEVKEFIETNGHSCIPSSQSSLQAWCGTQRKLWKMKQSNSTVACALTDEREERLDSINFDWQTSHEYVWQSRLEQLKAYKEENGHLNLGKNDGDLGVWADTQRTEMRFKKDGHHTHLTDERINQLEKLGFGWSIRDAAMKE